MEADFESELEDFAHWFYTQAEDEFMAYVDQIEDPHFRERIIKARLSYRRKLD